MILLLFSSHSQSERAFASEKEFLVNRGNVVQRSEDAYILYDAENQIWEVGTAGITRRMQYTPRVGYRLIGFTNKRTGRDWLGEGNGSSAEFRMVLNGQAITGGSADLILRAFNTRRYPDNSIELIVSLAQDNFVAHLHYVIFPQTSVIEQWAAVENTGPEVLPNLTALDSFSVALRPSTENLTLTWVQGLDSTAEMQRKTEPLPSLRLRSEVLSEGKVQELYSSGRSSEESMGWFALADPKLQEGIFGGIEWSGAWRLRASREAGKTWLRAGLEYIRHDISPGEIFEAPRRFVGFYQGDLDDAANASHVFARKYLLKQRPADFPWTQFNTWFAYYTDLNEETLKRDVDLAAELGLEAFYIDAGWYEGSPEQADFSFGLGTWRENRAKFPSGIRAFADYVHSKGMKFGVWVEPERVDMRYVGAGKPIPLEWLAPAAKALPDPPEGAAQTAQICLGNPQAQEWMKEWLTRIIRDFDVDWLKWDNNIWMSCDPPDQIGDGNYLHNQGLYEVLDYLRAEFPELIIENCASGGHRMDYGLMRRTDIAWLSDNTEPSYRTRYHMAGASFPFPPEYLNTWLVDSYTESLGGMEDAAVLRNWLRSRMMGAFGISVRLGELSPDAREAMAAEISRYKSIRRVIANGNLYRLLPQTDLQLPNIEPPAESDAAEFYDPISQTGAVFLFQGAVPWDRRRLILKGLSPDTVYEVEATDRSMVITRTGQQLMTRGVTFNFRADRPSVVLWLKPASAGAP